MPMLEGNNQTVSSEGNKCDYNRGGLQHVFVSKLVDYINLEVITLNTAVG